VIASVRFFNGGSCRQWLGLIDGKSWWRTRFHAVFLAFRHPTEGWILVDTGYGGRFAEATRRWPFKLYGWVTPVADIGGPDTQLLEAGIDPARIRHVVISHFHADHIGGLHLFSEAHLHFHEDALRTLAGLGPWGQLRSAFLPSLVPSDILRRGDGIRRTKFDLDPSLGLMTHDLFGDGKVRLVFLPGHAPGQVGVILKHDETELFYAADAFWDKRQIAEGLDITLPARTLQWDAAAYHATIVALRRLWREGHHRILACHCPATQPYIQCGES
jgi:glyoxylase-like metal-dependent hydrolase (beta-lactamase superfamily II)